LKIRADEHIAEQIVRAVKEIALSDQVELSHVIEAGDRGASDVHWVTQFAGDGGDVILTADTDFLKRPHQVKAIFDNGLKVIHLPHQWARARRDLQAAHILLWWRRIEAQVNAMKARQCYRVPWNLKETGALQQIKIDFQTANKKVRKEKKNNKS
jgi:predicted nuclease of predicted toxin-antitoxin system|tara:strand:+ start:961 stop:1425 length:465 start_codon:yes stop_codon:yes gene_type:complete